MQLIQLQPQIASQVPNPQAGSVSVFVDQSDNAIKTKDQNGTIVGGGGSGGGSPIVATTKSIMDGWIQNGSLTIGQFYKISGVHASLYGGTDIILQAASEITLSKQGLGLFYNPRYDNPASPSGGTHYFVWNNTDRISISGTTGYFAFDEPIIGSQGQTGLLVGVPGTSTMTFVSVSGNWATTSFVTGQTSGAVAAFVSYISAATYNINDKVIWGNSVWINITGAVGSTADANPPNKQLYLDTTNWALVNFNPTDYDLVADEIEYEYEFDNISYRKNNSNEVTSNYDWFSTNAWGYNNINRFPWGNPNVSDVKISNSYLDAIVNFPTLAVGYIKNVSSENGGGFDANYWGLGVQISGITIGKAASLISMRLGDNAMVSNVRLEDSSICNNLYISNNDSLIPQFKNIKLSVSSLLSGNQLYPDSYIQNIEVGIRGQFNTNILRNTSVFQDIITKNDSFFGNISLSASSQIYFVNVGTNSNFKNITGGNNTLIYDIETNNETYFGDFAIPTSFNTIAYVGLKTNSYFQNLTFTGSFNNIKYLDLGVAAGFFQTVLGANCQINNVGLANNSLINALTLVDTSIINNVQLNVNSQSNNCTNDGFTLNNIRIDVGANLNNVTFDSNASNAYLSLYSSTFRASVDITSMNSADFSLVGYAGIITLTSSNSAETLNSIVNGASFPQTITPSTGLTVVYVGTALTGITSDGLFLMPASAYVTNGSHFDYITFDTVSNGTYSLARQVGGQNYL